MSYEWYQLPVRFKNMNRTLLFVVWALVGLATLGCLLLRLGMPEPDGKFNLLCLAAALALLTGIFPFFAQVRIELGEKGVTIAYLLYDKLYPWEDVEKIHCTALEQYLYGVHVSTSYSLKLILVSGKHVSLSCRQQDVNRMGGVIATELSKRLANFVIPEEIRQTLSLQASQSMAALAPATAPALKARRRRQGQLKEERRVKRGEELALPRNRYTEWAFGD